MTEGGKSMVVDVKEEGKRVPPSHLGIRKQGERRKRN
jgi:hypothetical protein